MNLKNVFNNQFADKIVDVNNLLAKTTVKAN